MAKGIDIGQSRGVKLRDENGDGYGVKHTANEPHVLIGGNTAGAEPIDTYLAMKTVSKSLAALDDELCIEAHDWSMGTLVFQVSGTWSGKIVVEGAVDGVFINLSIVQPGFAIAFTGVNNDNQNGVYRALIISGYTHVRLRMSAYTSGSADVVMNTAPLVATPFVWQLVPENLNGRMQIMDVDSNVAKVDSMTDTLQIIEYEHHEIHSGSHFTISDYDTSVALNETLEFIVTTPDSLKWAHMTIGFASTLGATLDVYEGASNVVEGTSVTPKNNNRNSDTASVLTIIADPTSITDGTKILGFMAGAGRTAGFVSRDREIILKQDTTYLFRFTSLANSNAWSYVGEWYEHE
jgi:hypothetical protein